MRQIFEARVFAEEGQAHGADRAVTLLANDDFGNAFFRCFRVVNFIAVDEQNHVGVLLDSAGLAQIGHHRTFIRALL